MAIVLPAFTTSAVITSATLISQTDEQLNILMTDVKNYVQDNYNVILSSLSSDAAAIVDILDEKLTIFERVYLGAYNTDPLLDNEGFPLIVGAMYFNTVSTVLKVYSGSTWVSTITLDVFTKGEVQNSLPAIGLDTSLNNTPNVGQMTWNQDDYTANLGMPFGITQQVGQELYITVKNTSGHLLSQAKPVMATGTTGNSSRILCDYYDTLQASARKLIGVTTHDIANGADGLIVTFGKIHNIDTTGSVYSETWANGDILYISSTVLGGLTNIQPAYGTLRMPIGYVIHAHTNGSIFVRIQAQDENALVNTIDSKLALKANIASPTFTGTITAPTFSGALSGNASTATRFSGNPTINGTVFNGSANITIPVPDVTYGSYTPVFTAVSATPLLTGSNLYSNYIKVGNTIFVNINLSIIYASIVDWIAGTATISLPIEPTTNFTSTSQVVCEGAGSKAGWTIRSKVGSKLLDLELTSWLGDGSPSLCTLSFSYTI